MSCSRERERNWSAFETSASCARAVNASRRVSFADSTQPSFSRSERSSSVSRTSASRSRSFSSRRGRTSPSSARPRRKRAPTAPVTTPTRKPTASSHQSISTLPENPLLSYSPIGPPLNPGYPGSRVTSPDSPVRPRW
ncbi:MAG TPA: hypothetical protein ENJ47_03830 [Candidatus Acetothermia bacterium]|nr:hypothetical protein [Candidatus Acetothermia bacterium]